MILPKQKVFDICGVGDADIDIMVAVKDFPDMSLFQDLQDPLCRVALLVEPFALLLQHGDDLIPMLVQHTYLCRQSFISDTLFLICNHIFHYGGSSEEMA